MYRKTDFEQLLRTKFREAATRGAMSVRLNSGDLHRELGGYPGTKHAMPTCCIVMHEATKQGDTVISSPPSGRGATLTIEYRLPR
jgi:hypothetical protein